MYTRLFQKECSKNSRRTGDLVGNKIAYKTTSAASHKTSSKFSTSTTRAQMEKSIYPHKNDNKLLMSS